MGRRWDHTGAQYRHGAHRAARHALAERIRRGEAVTLRLTARGVRVRNTGYAVGAFLAVFIAPFLPIAGR